MDKAAANQILFDFEVIALIALTTGLAVYFLVRRSGRATTSEGIGSQYRPLDLALMLFPLSFFLLNPIWAHFGHEISDSNPEELKENGEKLTQFGMAFSQLLFFLSVAIITWVMIRWITLRDGVEILGLRRMRVVPILIIGIASTLLSFGLCNVLIGGFSSEYLTEKLGKLEVQRAVLDLQEASSVPVIVVTVVAACIFAPVAEEMLFRGYFYGALKRFTSPVFAALVSSALFAVVHMNLSSLVPLWVFALILTAAYEWTRSLWVPIAIHGFFNLLNVVILFSDRLLGG